MPIDNGFLILSKGPLRITQSGPCIDMYITGKATRYLARPSS